MTEFVMAPQSAWPAIVALAEEAAFGVLILDAEGRVVWENAALGAMLGHAPGERSPALGERLVDLPSLVAAGATPLVAGLLAGEPLDGVLIELRSAAGRDVSLHVRGAPVLNPTGAIGGYWLLARDPTGEQPQAGRMIAVQRLEIVGLAVTGLIHDLNNILTGLGGTLELLASGKEASPELRQALDGMVRRASDIAGRLLEVARPSDNRREPMDLRTPVRQAADLMRFGLGAHVSVELSLPAEQVPALGDRTALLQCLFNLGTNARDAMPRGGKVTIDLSVVRDPAETARRGWPGAAFGRLTVADQGPGIPAEAAARIFDPFFTTKGGEGTGMGLAVVHRVVRDHGGKVTLHPAERGACFVIELPMYPGPVTDDEPTRSMTVPASLLIEGPPLAGLRVLVADDEEALRLMLEAALAARGAEIFCVEDGPSALAALQASIEAGVPFDRAIIDMNMPGLSGLDLLSALAGRAPELKLIASSGLEPGSHDAKELEALGASFLLKPYRLGMAVEALLAR